MSNNANYRKSRSGGVTLHEITTMLLDGGYFRAKIRTLTDFDKVAGGLAWGILNSRFSIDVEFVENAHIRDKIRIAENICSALKDQMQCPHDLEPHQIQGLDYPKISIILEWLLKRVAAAREENAYFVSQFTELDFARRFRVPYDVFVKAASAQTGAEDATRSAEDRKNARFLKAPKRVMLSTKVTYDSKLEHAATVLLEYGLKYQLKDSVLLLRNTDELDGDSEMQRAVVKMQDDEQKEQQMLESLLSQMTSHKEKNRIGHQHMSTIMQTTTDGDKISKLRLQYEARRSELLQRQREEEEARNAVEAQKQRLVELKEETATTEEEISAQREELNALQEAQQAAQEKGQRKLRRVEEQIESVEEIERMIRSDAHRSSLLDRLTGLLEEERQLAAKLEDDQTKGKQRIAEAKEEVLELAERSEQQAGPSGQELFEQELVKVRADLATVLGDLAKKDQQAMGIMRKIDEFPTRAELQQYQIRIGELDEEIAWKFEATRLSFTLYNTRTEIVKCLENEEDIFKQVAQLFDVCLGKNAAKKNAAERSQLLEQTSAIIGQLKASLIKQQERLQEEFRSISTAKLQYDQLLEKQQEYHRLVDAMKECLEENASLREEIGNVTGGGEDDDGGDVEDDDGTEALDV